jgi:hypothetical protein
MKQLITASLAIVFCLSVTANAQQAPHSSTYDGCGPTGAAKGDWRATVWEIHPVTKTEILR